MQTLLSRTEEGTVFVHMQGVVAAVVVVVVVVVVVANPDNGRYLYTCKECPQTYPWIKNEFGLDFYK